ncbi:hypothetical protein niasHT_001656 [Heterodera trifolii]|uniref:CCHC-type domain-containing protein n=1 Tax=Heterodera trifolii TaxID=157864 RepID=A0ABD2M3M7_9BILA
MLSEEQWEQLLMRRDTVFGRRAAIFRDSKGEFGTINLFAIVGAADLIVRRGGSSQISDITELRRRMRKAQLEHHTNRFPDFNNLGEDEQGRILRRAQLIGAIWNIAFGSGSAEFSLQEYLGDMDFLGLWDVYFEEGAHQDQEFDEDYPIPPGIVELIAQQTQGVPPNPQSDDAFCCWRCGLAGHRASNCPIGGSWARNSLGQLIRRGGQPRCFVCCLNTDHMSADCPYRAPESRLRTTQCWNCHIKLQGRAQKQNTCWNCHEPLRCWNCGAGHRLKDCPKPRRAPQSSKGGNNAQPKPPREQRFWGK